MSYHSLSKPWRKGGDDTKEGELGMTHTILRLPEVKARTGLSGTTIYSLSVGQE
jgi:hypothetical protein